MKVNGFPFRVDKRTHFFLSGLISSMNESGAKMQSLMHEQCVLTFDKSLGAGVDTMVRFTGDGIVLRYPLQTVVKSNNEVSTWLNKFHAFLQGAKKDKLTPVRNRCHVDVIGHYSGRLDYHLTYLVIHTDESTAQDTPQGALYSSESLNVARAVANQPRQEEEAKEGFW